MAPLRAEADAGVLFSVDLERQEISTNRGSVQTFELEPRRKEALLHGWDETAIILNNEVDAIAAFQNRQKQTMPWLYSRN